MTGSNTHTNNDFGTDADRLLFLRYLRDDQRFTQEDLASRTLHSVDTVKAWFSENPNRKRSCQDRSILLLLNSLGITERDYWRIVESKR